MNRRLVSILVLLALTFVSNINDSSARRLINTKQNNGGKKPYGFSDIIGLAPFSFGDFNGTWISDTEFYYRDTNRNLLLYNAETQNTTKHIDAAVLARWNIDAIYFSKDDQGSVLIRYDVRSISRHSIVAKYVVFNTKTEIAINISGTDELNLCIWSSNYQGVVYVKNNDVYYWYKFNARPKQITMTGIDGVIYNGIPDWVYEEAGFGSGSAMWMSPDRSKLAIATFNDTLVKEFVYYLYKEDKQNKTEVRLRYPKAGQLNPRVELKYLDLTKRLFIWKDIQPPVAKVTGDHILKSVMWVDNNRLGAFWLNRRQNYTVFQLCQFDNNSCVEPFEITEPNGWVELDDAICTSNGSDCYFIGFVGNWRNIIRYNVSTGEISPVYQASLTVQRILGIKESTNEIFYTATTVTHSNHRHVYKNGQCLTCDLEGPERIPCTFASASFSSNFSYYTAQCTGPMPSYSKIFRTSDNSEIIAWEENLPERAIFEEYEKIRVHHLRVPVPGGFTASVNLFIPQEIDPLADEFTKQYPMIVDVNGGPNFVHVTDSFSLGFKAYLITTHKVIYCQIDGRGAGSKGKNHLFTLNNNLGTVEVEDQIIVAKYLQDQFEFIDANRTGIWGWGYGGFATAMAMVKDSDMVFQCGISVAPVTSWIYYNTIYTERYMGLPTETDNLAGYNGTDVTRLVNQIGKHKFMVVHGDADENVHFQQTMALTKSLVANNIDFEQVSYRNEAHGLNGVSAHLYHSMKQFWRKCLHF